MLEEKICENVSGVEIGRVLKQNVETVEKKQRNYDEKRETNIKDKSKRENDGDIERNLHNIHKEN